MNFHKIKSYGKINLALNVIGKLTKLHKIESIVSFTEFHDLIFVRLIKTRNHKVSFFGKFSKNISKNNTVSKLLRLLDKKKLLNDQKFEIKIKKNIPQKAGLGGGSMNAGSLLNFFLRNKIIKLKKNQKIISLTKEIGSDVIFGIKPKNTIFSLNSKISKLDIKNKLYVLLVKPKYGCSTKYMYSKIKDFTKPSFNHPKKSMFNHEYLKKLKNDLEKIAFSKYPELKKIKFFLKTLPNVLFVRMTGSGSTIVAYFHSKKASKKAYSQYKRKFTRHWCIESKTI
jgi:4-diphosphocytidyl-2-C-methyl-D-erythritol kinase